MRDPTTGIARTHCLLVRMLTRKERAREPQAYRIMKQYQLLISPHSGVNVPRVHEGMIRTLESNQWWCSDVFEIPCPNGEVVRVVFSPGLL